MNREAQSQAKTSEKVFTLAAQVENLSVTLDNQQSLLGVLLDDLESNTRNPDRLDMTAAAFNVLLYSVKEAKEEAARIAKDGYSTYRGLELEERGTCHFEPVTL